MGRIFDPALSGRIENLAPGVKMRSSLVTARRQAMPQDFTPHQQKIIKRYYNNLDAIQRQKLAELVSELYLSEGKKRQRVWKSIASALDKLGYSAERIAHLVLKDNPALIAELVKELEKK
jgi:hypothetical protein